MTYTVKPNELDVCPKLEAENYDLSDWMKETMDTAEKLAPTPVRLPMRLKPLSNDPYLDSRV